MTKQYKVLLLVCDIDSGTAYHEVIRGTLQEILDRFPRRHPVRAAIREVVQSGEDTTVSYKIGKDSYMTQVSALRD